MQERRRWNKKKGDKIRSPQVAAARPRFFVKTLSLVVPKQQQQQQQRRSEMILPRGEKM